MSDAIQTITTEPRPLRLALIAFVSVVLALLVGAPLVTVFAEALSEGLPAAIESLTHPEAADAIRLTLIVAAVAVAGIRHRGRRDRRRRRRGRRGSGRHHGELHECHRLIARASPSSTAARARARPRSPLRSRAARARSC